MKKALVIAIVAGWLLPADVNACPGCASGLDDSLGRGLNASILFMIAMPFTIVAAVAVGIVFVYRNASVAPKDGARAEFDDSQRG